MNVLQTAERLEVLPETREAFLAGRLSEVQTREIASSGAADHATETMLLQTAASQPVSKLQEECRRVRAASVTDAVEANEQIRRRFLRTWTETDGAVRLDARLTPDAGAEVIATIEARRARIFDEARRAGRRESSQAYAADALVELARESGSTISSGPRAMVHVFVDHRVLTSGDADGDRTCEIPGVGPVPAATARMLAEDSILRVLVTKDADITAVTGARRTIPARIRAAIEARDPVCVVPTCHTRHGLEIDHYRIPFASGGPTRLDNLARLCWWHHYQKTHLGYRLSGGPGAWDWETPDQRDGSWAEARPPPDD